jgi:hypothetical protein
MSRQSVRVTSATLNPIAGLAECCRSLDVAALPAEDCNVAAQSESRLAVSASLDANRGV